MAVTFIGNARIRRRMPMPKVSQIDRRPEFVGKMRRAGVCLRALTEKSVVTRMRRNVSIGTSFRVGSQTRLRERLPDRHALCQTAISYYGSARLLEMKISCREHIDNIYMQPTADIL